MNKAEQNAIIAQNKKDRELLDMMKHILISVQAVSERLDDIESKLTLPKAKTKE